MKTLWPSLILALVLALIARELFPKTVTVGRIIPTIVTQHDTVRTRWVDTLWKVKVTTDTYNLVVKETVHDTVQVYVGQDTSQRPPLWPVVSYDQHRPDSATIRTFSLRSGTGVESMLFAPGPLTGLYADSTGVPRVNFGTWPRTETSWLTKVLWGGIGFGVCRLAH